MPKHILVIDGHPDASSGHYVHALAREYCNGAQEGGHELRSIIVSQLDFPLLRKKEDFDSGAAPQAIQECQKLIAWADHIVILYPLWLGSMPALLKGFFEQVLRPGFAFGDNAGRGFPKKLLSGKSARIVVTMGMPGFLYRWYFLAHSLKSLERNVLGFCGIRPIRTSLIGMIETMSQAARGNWLNRMRTLGAEGR